MMTGAAAPAQGRGTNLPRGWCLTLFCLALLVRLVFVFQWQAMPYGASPQLDADMYDKWAWDLAQGGAGPAGAFYQSPLYPYVLSVLYRLFGHSLLAAGIFNACLDAATVVLLARLAQSLGGRGAGVATGIMAALFAPMVFYVAPPMKEPLSLFLFASFVALAFGALRVATVWRFAAAGAVLGLAVITRGNALLLAPVLPVFAFLRWRRAALMPVAAFLLTLCAAIAPVTAHNLRAGGDFVLLTYDGGFNLYIGHSPYANGVNAIRPKYRPARIRNAST